MAGISETEQQLKDLLERQGWKIFHKGWPDFVCIKDSEMVFIEVKGYRGEHLKKEQHIILTNLAQQGLECYKWNPESGFEKISPSFKEFTFRPGYNSTERGGRSFSKPIYNEGRFH